MNTISHILYKRPHPKKSFHSNLKNCTKILNANAKEFEIFESIFLFLLKAKNILMLKAAARNLS